MKMAPFKISSLLPDWMIEILSPDQNPMKLVKKILIGWITAAKWGGSWLPKKGLFSPTLPGSSRQYMRIPKR
jgi:hypothetical protein